MVDISLLQFGYPSDKAAIESGCARARDELSKARRVEVHRRSLMFWVVSGFVILLQIERAHACVCDCVTGPPDSRVIASTSFPDSSPTATKRNQCSEYCVTASVGGGPASPSEAHS